MPLPLEEIRILDLTHDWSGPHATRILADFGADVIKVEYVRRIDGMRGGRLEDRAYDRHPRWLQINRNKRSVTLDLKKPRNRDMFLDLVRLADALVENSRPGVMEGLGLGYAELSGLKSDLIYLSMPAFGATGPEAGYAGYGAAIEGLSGLQSLTAYEPNGRPKRVKEMDVTNGVVGACALMTAIVHRQRTGRGQHIDLSQLEAASHTLMGEHFLEFTMNGRQSLPVGNRSLQHAPQGCYPCLGQDRWIALTVQSDSQWQALCAVIVRPDLAESPELAEVLGRVRRHAELDDVIAAWTRTRASHQVMGDLQAAGIPAGTVLTVADLASDPHLLARNWLLTGGHGDSPMFPGAPFRINGVNAGLRSAGPRLGEHNREILCGTLGYAEAAIPAVQERDIGTAFDPE
jgi:crotonobetainyl-CoA:carnitine CoA-transferase CaiB-like acyl-CoA transferase